jgi:hypothetical protein
MTKTYTCAKCYVKISESWREKHERVCHAKAKKLERAPQPKPEQEKWD